MYRALEKTKIVSVHHLKKANIHKFFHCFIIHLFDSLVLALLFEI